MKKITFLSLFIGLILVLYYFFSSYIDLYLYKDKQQLNFNSEKINLKISKALPFTEVGDFLLDKGYIIDKTIINKLIIFKNYDSDTLKAGKYSIIKNWSNNKLVNQLFLMRKQNIIDLYVPSVRNINILAGKIASQTTIDSTELINALNDSKYHKKMGFTSSSFSTLFLPNTFEAYANINIDDFLSLMSKAYKSFWNKERRLKANRLGLSQSEITVLASIVQMEQQLRVKEHSKIAGLYINRLKKGMKLQADPTVKFALNQPKLKRVLNRHLKHDSPYNTYLYKGLPPGPICLPEITVIDAVLNYDKHDFIYMCAEPTYSGNHNFAVSYKDHMANYQLYKDWLNKEGIK